MSFTNIYKIDFNPLELNKVQDEIKTLAPYFRALLRSGRR